jgi:SAM-dependent methyltransferase
MEDGPVRAGSDWLALREPADAAARAAELVELLRPSLPAGGAEIHDLGCGTGSMARWLAARLHGPQHWVLHDRDEELLVHAAANPPAGAGDGAAVSVEAHGCDITRLDAEDLAGADLITASALLDMMTGDELDRLVAACGRASCPVLVTLSVVGRVDLVPAEPLDSSVRDAFNAHQRRPTTAGRLLGPDAAQAAVDGFTRLGHRVLVRESPWRLGPAGSALAATWFTGWLAAACEQRPELEAATAGYARRRLAQAAAGSLSVTVHHWDLLARP